MIKAELRRLVIWRAGNRCEYCRIDQDALPFFRFHLEHIVSRQHDGPDDPHNLALACGHCNRYKGPNLSALDPISGWLVPLYNPRAAVWLEHFDLMPGGEVVGLSDIGRATVRLLRMNEPQYTLLRGIHE